MKKTWLCIVIFGWSLPSLAQDSSVLNTFLKNFSLDLSGGGYYQGPPNPKELRLPEYIQDTRKQYNASFNASWTHTQDNPLYHAAYFIGANSKLKISKGFTLFANFIGEHRGFSYGVNNTNAILVYPQLKAAIDKQWTLWNRPLRFFGSIGHQINPLLYEGLMLYNLYQQGHDYKIRWGKFQLNYVELSDLTNGIGLGIDDSYDVIGSFEGLSLGQIWRTDVRFGYSFNPLSYYTPLKYRDMFHLSSGFYTKPQNRYYVQLSYRPQTDSLFVPTEMLGALIGFTTELKSRKLKFCFTGEARYYGSGFNADFKKTSVKYRDATKNTNYANSVGNYFYPMFLYDRPFSQWAVYTEYQTPGKYLSVVGGVFRVNGVWSFYQELQLRADIDFNFIWAENQHGFIYPFYTAGFSWQPEERTYILLGVSNKGMNLDVHYPTFYNYQNPVFTLLLRRELGVGWWEGHR